MFVKSVVLELVQDEVPVIYLPESFEDESTKELQIFLRGLEAANAIIQAELLDREYMMLATESQPIEEEL